jgi:hypothetical protein
MIVRTALAFERFTAIPNTWARDRRISRRARGLLLELMSHREGWRITVDSLVEGGPEGKDAVRSGLNELVKAGYLTRVQRRAEGGTFGEADWELHDPFEDVPPSAGNPQTADPAPKKTTSKKKNPLPPSGVLPLDELAPETPPAKKPRRKPSSAIPDDWSPTDAHREQAAALPGVDVDVEASKFRDHAEANDRRQVSWDAAFRMWLTRAGEYAARNAPPPGSEDAPPADAWMYLGSGQPRKTYADYADPEAPRA